MARMTALRRRMIEDMKIRNLSPVTQRCYVHAVAKFAQAFQPVARSLGAGGGTGLPDPPHLHRHLVGRLQCRSFGTALLLRRHPGTARDGRAHPLRPQAAAAARDPERRRDSPVFRGGAEPEASHRADGGLRRRPAGLRSRAAAGRRYRQGPHADPGRTGQGTSGPVRHAVGAAARHVARLLARRPTKTLAVSRPRRETAARRQYAPLGVPELLARRRSLESP